MSTRALGRVLAAVMALALGALINRGASAHPLGNNTVNRQAAITIGADAVTVDYRLNLAEIPTLIAAQDADRDHDGTTTASEWTAYTDSWAATQIPALTLTADQQSLDLRLSHRAWRLEDGAADLNVLHLHAVYQAALPASAKHSVLRYADQTRPSDAGWREIWVATAAGAEIVATSAARRDRSHGLTDFPVLTSDLPHEIDATVEVRLNPAPGERSQAASATLHTPRPMTSVLASSAPVARMWSLFRLGLWHIATGWDHLVFLLGLLLLSQSLRDLIKIVTAFTLAHSLSLAFAAAGLITPPGALVEPAIALTIAYVGYANLVGGLRAHGLSLAFAFGLIHGLGFAGALAQTLGAHPQDGRSWLLDLAAFNLGIESFQVLLLLLIVPAARQLRDVAWAATAHRGAAFSVFGVGLAWFGLRVSGV